jgi:hypothetical protein
MPWTPEENLAAAVRRFWRDTDTSGGADACWPWGGVVHDSGYGTMFVNGGSPRLQKAHRFAYALLVGPIPEGTEIDHACHTKACPTPGYGDTHRRCVNPRHLEAVTRRVNVLRGQAPEITAAYLAAKRGTEKVCPRGHTYPVGQRCRPCNYAGVKAWRARRKAAGLSF